MADGKYIIQDRESGTVIEEVNTLEEAKAIVEKYETEDKAEGNFEEDFYEIVCLKYELRKATAEIKLSHKNEIKAGCTLVYHVTESRDIESEVIATFGNIDDARKALEGYESTVSLDSSFASKFYMVTEYYIEENVYSEDGEWMHGGDVWDFSKMRFGNEEYYLFEKYASGGNSYKKYSFQELKTYFEDKEADEDEREAWENIEDIHDLEIFIDEYVNNNGGVHYHDYYIEEV